MQLSSSLRRLAVSMAALGLSSCVPYGDGSGEVRGSVRVPRCSIGGVGVYQDATFPDYDLRPDFYAAELRGRVLQVRVQRDPRRFSASDTLTLEVRDVNATPVGVPVELRPDLEPGGGVAAPARLTLGMFASCPRFETSLQGRGTVTFNALDSRDEGLVDATFTVNLVDGQSLRSGTTEAVYGELRGRVRMKLHLLPEEG